MKLATLGIAAVFTLAGAVSASAQTTTLRYVSAAPLKSPWAAQSQRFADDVDKASNGDIAIQLFNGGVLGSEQETIRQVIRGRVDLGGFSLTAASLVVPEMSLMAAPFLWDSYKQMDCVMDKHMFRIYDVLFRQKNAIVVGWSEVGWINVYGKEPLLKPTDLNGRKMRVAPAKSSASFFRAMKANGVALPIGEINPALQTGLVNGGSYPNLTYVLLGTGKLAPHLTLTRHLHQSGVVLMSARSFARMSAEAQKGFTAALLPPAELRGAVRAANDIVMLGLHKKNGGTVHELTDAEREEWKTYAIRAGVHEKLISDVGGEAADIWRRIQRAKTACPAA